MTDIAGLTHILSNIRDQNPDKLYIFNLAAQSHVGVSFETPLYTAQVDAIGPLNLLEAVRSTGLSKIARVYQASTSELYGKVQEVPQSETTPFYPRSPYGVAKLYAYWIMKNYREAYGMHTCNGVLFNHESERRGKTFVTRKITLAVAGIKRALDAGEPVDPLALGNLDARRDWGHARDYVRGMIRILEQPRPDDYVLATGETHSVREFVEKAFAVVDIAIQWKGEGVNEVGVDTGGRVLVRVDERYFRPAEVDELLGNAIKAKQDLGWVPEISFDQLVELMVKADIETK
jgi:GDPmannose 4,6-dehydratase